MKKMLYVFEEIKKKTSKNFFGVLIFSMCTHKLEKCSDFNE